MEKKINAAEEEMEIDLVELFRALLHRAWLIVSFLIIGALLALGYTKLLVTPMYSATAQIYMVGSSVTITSLSDLQLGESLTVDFETMAKSRTVVTSVIDELGIDMNYGSLLANMAIENPAGTRILRLTVQDADPERAKEIVDTWAEETADRVANVMNTDKPKVFEKAIVPGAPSSPNTVKNVLLGGLLGAALAMGLIVLSVLMNDTVQTEDDIRRHLGVNTLAVLPLEKRKKKREK